MGDRMAKRNSFLEVIKEKGSLVLDGAFGTELERHGCDIRQGQILLKALVTKLR